MSRKVILVYKRTNNVHTYTFLMAVAKNGSKRF